MNLQILIIDSNVLVLYVAGLVNPELIGSKRLEAFSHDDYGRLLEVIGRFDQLVITPNVLTETSNLLRLIPNRRADDRSAMTAVLKRLAKELPESYVPSALALDHPRFNQLGLTDATLLQCLNDGGTLLTADLALHHAAVSMNLNAINFNHGRNV